MQLAATSISPISHRLPANPGEQLQLKPLIRSMQVPLFKQVILTQSFISAGERIKDIKKKKTKTKTKKMLNVPFSQGTLDLSKSQNTTSKCKRCSRGWWRNVSINRSLHRSSREIEICGRETIRKSKSSAWYLLVTFLSKQFLNLLS